MRRDNVFDYDSDAADDTWRLYALDVDAPCYVPECDSPTVTWEFRGLMYCDRCAQQLRDVLERLVEAQR